MLPGGTGTITLVKDPFPDADADNNDRLLKITVAVSWNGARGANSGIEVATLLSDAIQ